MKENSLKNHERHVLGIAFGITLLILLSAGGAGAATNISACGTISQPGEYALNTSIIDSGAATCINIVSSDIVFDGNGNTIDALGGGGISWGVHVFNSTTTLTNVTIINLTVTDWHKGIYYQNVKNGNITNNTATSNDIIGIYLENSDNNNITDNNVSANGNGIQLYGSNFSTLINNGIDSNNVYGIFISTITQGPGSCPFLYTWDGNNYTFTGDLAGHGILGVPRDGGYRTPRPEDYAKIESGQLQQKDGNYSMQIVQEYDEISYMDELSLIAVDHSPGVDTYLSLERGAKDKIYTVSKNPSKPLSCVADDGSNCLPQISSRDGIYTNATETKINTVELNLGDLSSAQEIKLIVSGYTEFIPGVSGVSRIQGQFVQVKDASGNWVNVLEGSQLDNPAAMPRTYVINLTGKFLTSDYSVRIGYGAAARWDYIAVDTTPQQAVTTIELTPVSADLHYRGYSMFNGGVPSLPDYGDVSAAPPSGYSEPAGNFTRFGDVLQLLTAMDDKFVIMHHGDEISLLFSSSPAQEGMERDFLVHTWDYYKNQFYETGGTVDPLPFRNMSTYPYPADENYPNTAEYMAYLSEYNTRYYAGGGGGCCSYNEIINNNISNNGNAGIYIEKEDNTLIEGNNVSNNRGDGIRLSVSSNNNTLSGNNITRNRANGIYLSSSPNNTISNNNVSYNNQAHQSNAGLNFQGSNNSNITGNYVSNNPENGVKLISSNNNNFTDNDIVYNCGLLFGVYIQNGNYNIFNKNNISFNTGIGVQISSSIKNLFLDNTINSNANYGIALSTSSSNDFTGNNVSNNGFDGINMQKSSNNNLTNNTAKNNANWDFNSNANSLNNQVTNLEIGSTIVSFGSKDIALKNAVAPAPDPLGFQNIGKYINAIKNSADSWLFLNVSYNQSDLISLNESTLRIAKYNGSWITDPSAFANNFGVNTADNYVFANITNFGSIFAPLGVKFTATKDFRNATVNFTAVPAQLGNLLPQNGSKYNVTYVIPKRKGDGVASTIPGEFYGVVTINGTGVSNVTFNDTFSASSGTTQFNVSPAKLGGGVEIIRYNNTTGVATILTNTTQIKSASVNNTAHTVNLTIQLNTPLAGDESLMVYIKFGTALKGLSPNPADFVNKANVLMNGIPGTAKATINFV